MILSAPNAEFLDHADFYRRGPYARYLTDRKVIGREPVTMFAAEQPAGHFPDPAMPTVLLYLAKKGVKEAHFDWGAGRWRGMWRGDDLTLVPPNAASDVTLSDRHSFVGLCLPLSMFANDDDATGHDSVAQMGNLYAAPFRDKLAKEVFDTLWREGNCGDAAYSMFADNALQFLVDRLRYLARAPAPLQERSYLSHSVLRRLDDFIHAHLDAPIKVADLASVTGHSPAHFTFLFKRTTGCTPYRHVLALRVEHAKQLIAARPKQSLAEIALASGFSSQSHMTVVFRQMTGATPASAVKINHI